MNLQEMEGVQRESRRMAEGYLLWFGWFCVSFRSSDRGDFEREVRTEGILRKTNRI
jgi:hypothetical protein